MGRAAFGLAWAFIALAAGYDCYFAWEYRHALPEWELNPIASWAALSVGLHGLISLKIALLFFALAVAVYCRIRCRDAGRRITQVGCATYFLLGLHYVVGQSTSTVPRVHAKTWTQAAAFDPGRRSVSFPRSTRQILNIFLRALERDKGPSE
jgi:hypothetical protein